MRRAVAAKATCLVALCASLVTGCMEPGQAPDKEAGRVPIVDDQGEIVGTVDAESLEEVEDKGSVPVHDDSGQVVGSFSPAQGFQPSG